MIPVYFPFTHISTPVAEAICRSFGGLVVYRPLEQIPAQHREVPAGRLPIDIRVPAKGDDQRLIDLYHEYRKWGDFHEDGTHILKKWGHDIPDAETFVTQIRSDIFSGGSRRPEAPDPLFSARLFLLAAHDYDAAKETVDQAMAASEINMARLVSELKGTSEPPDADNVYVLNEDPGAIMTEARLLSWYRLARRDPDVDFGFLITTSSAVCDALMDHAPSGRLLRSWDGLPSPADEKQRAAWAACLNAAAGMAPDESTMLSELEIPAALARSFTFRLYLFTGLTPEQLMNAGLSGQNMEKAMPPGVGSVMVGLLETKETRKRVLDSIL
jgi:hypothetical protein